MDINQVKGLKGKEMSFFKERIIDDVKDYIGGGDYSHWYVGITTDIESRLFADCNVDKEKDYWIYRKANSTKVARQVKTYFLKQGADGGEGEDNEAKYIYAYKRIDKTTT